MTLAEFLTRTCGACSSWEEASQRLGVSESAIRMASEVADPAFAGYFDRQRERLRESKRAAEPEPLDDPGDPYADVDAGEAA